MKKIFSIEQASRLSHGYSSSNHKVVLAHGVFDVLHLGHIRHLKEAKSLGNMLIVSITDDQYVNKGPGRPVFKASMRAEMLASLEFVDLVVVNESPTSVPLINTLQPAIYVKGKEYSVEEDDVTGGIEAERNAVEAYGGKIAFTDDIVFSSSSIINETLDIHDPAVKAFLETIKKRYRKRQFTDLIEGMKDLKVLFVGDMIIDEYKYVSAMGKSAKEAIIATKYAGKEVFAGGVAAAANHLASLSENVSILTLLGGLKDYRDLISSQLNSEISFDYLVCPDRPTTRKQRFVSEVYLRKMFETYYFDDHPLEDELQSQFDSKLKDIIDDFDVVIVTDFGHGLIANSTIEILQEHAKFLAVNAQSNSANHGFNLITKYSKVDFICIDMPEARLAVADKYGSPEKVIAEGLANKIQCENMIVTNGKRGAVAWSKADGFFEIPALTESVVDTVGAGDAFFSIAAPVVAKGGAIEQAAFLGNMAGAMKVNIVGHRKSVERAPFIKYLTALLK